MSRTRSFVVLTTLLAGLAVFAGAAAQTHDHGSHDGHDHGPGQPQGQKLTTAPPGTVPRAPRGRAIQLVATVPVESSIGDPTLPGTAETWVSMIDSARKTIELEHFYLSHWPGERTGPVLDAIGRSPVADRIHLLERINPFPVLRAADLLVVPSLYEGFGMTILEAITLGVTVLATDIPGPREFLGSGYGYTCPNSTEGLAEGMLAFLDGGLPPVRASIEAYLAQAGREFSALFGPVAVRHGPPGDPHDL